MHIPCGADSAYVTLAQTLDVPRRVALQSDKKHLQQIAVLWVGF
jgi:hypothetical protein